MNRFGKANPREILDEVDDRIGALLTDFRYYFRDGADFGTWFDADQEPAED